MKKKIIIFIVLALIAVSTFFVLKNRPGADEQNLQAMRDSIVSEPAVKTTALTAEQIDKRVEDFRKTKDSLVTENFDNLQLINQIALYKQQLGDLEGARIAWEYANIIRPQNSLSFSNLAALYHFDLKQYDKAEKNYLISIANDPDDIPTIRNFFELYRDAIKDNSKAEALLLRSIEQNPEAADLYSLLGRFYEETGNRDKAIEYYKKHLELNPTNQAVKNAIARLEAAK